MATATPRERVRAVIAPPVAEAGFDLEDVELTPAGSRRVLRVVVDRDGGLDLDAVAAVSRVVDAALESDDVLGGTPYVLEVTSPGVDRPLTEPRHWRRAVTRLVEVPLKDGGSVRGRVLAADEQVVELEVAGERRTYPLESLGKGRVQVEFGPVREAGAP
ncbi:MAG: ribosome maturation factor RimP [Frankiales bacterium]|jgi:ribosome maturation factor RimP|nr:ribosome maturation factor RimP [Frankiales bacterium]